MVYLESLNIRPALPEDATTFAALHADSWRRNYRGAYSDAYLDGDVLSDRLAVWGERLSAPSPLCSTLVAEADDVMVGFAHTAFEESPAWGALPTTSTWPTDINASASARNYWPRPRQR